MIKEVKKILAFYYRSKKSKTQNKNILSRGEITILFILHGTENKKYPSLSSTKLENFWESYIFPIVKRCTHLAFSKMMKQMVGTESEKANVLWQLLWIETFCTLKQKYWYIMTLKKINNIFGNFFFLCINLGYDKTLKFDWITLSIVWN